MALRFGTFVLNESARQLTSAGTNIHLTPKAFQLLLLLVAEAPRVLTKAELHERLWPQTYVSDAALLGLVKELRRALEDHDSDSPMIRTVHRVGYGFAIPVEHGADDVEGPVAHWIILRSGPLALRNGQNIVGRDPEVQVCIDSAEVSRRHACIQVNDDGAYIQDLGSKNGTSVADRLLSGQVALQDGDRVAFGSVVGIYRSSAAGMSTVTRSAVTSS
jgi:DNA-binding winged helix-turn-helix (wHTH) protein